MPGIGNCWLSRNNWPNGCVNSPPISTARPAVLCLQAKNRQDDKEGRDERTAPPGTTQSTLRLCQHAAALGAERAGSLAHHEQPASDPAGRRVLVLPSLQQGPTSGQRPATTRRHAV